MKTTILSIFNHYLFVYYAPLLIYSVPNAFVGDCRPASFTGGRWTPALEGEWGYTTLL